MFATKAYKLMYLTVDNEWGELHRGTMDSLKVIKAWLDRADEPLKTRITYGD